MRRRTEKTIRKLAGVEDPRNPRLGPAKARAPIARTRSIAYATADGIEHSSSSGSDANEQTVPGATDTDQNAEIMNQIIGAIDSGGGTNNAGGGNGQKRPADQVAQTKKGDATKSVTGNDFTGGTDGGSIKVVMNAVDEPAREKPPNWPDPDSPPTVSDWVSGYEWILGGAASAAPNFATKSQVQAWAAANLVPDGYAEFGNDTQWYKSGGDWNGEGRSTYNWNETSCTPTPGDPTCPTVAPVDDWPADGQCHLSWDTASGTFKGNAYDSDCSGAQISGTAEVYIEDGGIRKKISHLANGGFKITDVDGSNVDDPAGYTRIYSADGILESITTTGVGGQVE